MGLFLYLLVHLLPLLPYKRLAMRLRCLFSFQILFFKVLWSATDFQKIRANLYIVLLLSFGRTSTDVSRPALVFLLVLLVWLVFMQRLGSASSRSTAMRIRG